MGMGAMLTHTVKLLKYADDNQLHPVIAYTNPLYATGIETEWFDQYFQLQAEFSVTPKARSGLSYLKLSNERSLCGIPLPNRMELNEARRLFLKYITIRPSIYALVDDLMRDVDGKVYDISIHYRGTDKNREANTISYEKFADAVDRLVRERLDVRSAFLATDEKAFAEYIRRRFPKVQFSSFDLGEGNTDLKPRHFSSMSGHDKAIEALVNMISISRSAICIRTCSYLSAWSRILNPNLETRTMTRLNRHAGSFPEREVLESEAALETFV
jgi:hypothetical protein